MNTGQHKHIFENRNGKKYTIIQQENGVAMIMGYGGSTVIVCDQINHKTKDWGRSYYFEIMCPDAVKKYHKLVYENLEIAKKQNQFMIDVNRILNEDRLSRLEIIYNTSLDTLKDLIDKDNPDYPDTNLHHLENAFSEMIQKLKGGVA